MYDGTVSQEKVRKTMGDSTEMPFAAEESQGGVELVVRTQGFSDINNFEDS